MLWERQDRWDTRKPFRIQIYLNYNSHYFTNSPNSRRYLQVFLQYTLFKCKYGGKRREKIKNHFQKLQFIKDKIKWLFTPLTFEEVLYWIYTLYYKCIIHYSYSKSKYWSEILFFNALVHWVLKLVTSFHLYYTLWYIEIINRKFY